MSCQVAGPVAAIVGLPEASGLAVSRSVPGRLWTHNDSGQPVLYALDGTGTVTARLRLSGVTVEDWEAVAVGPCPEGSCVFVADIGDNNASRQSVSIYRFKEPGGEGDIAVKDVFHATYPDGPHDAEALLVTRDGRVLIVTKGDSGAVALYRFPPLLKPGETHRLERVGAPRQPAKPGPDDRITDGAVSVDGDTIVLRTRSRATFHRTSDLLAGNWQPARTIDLASIREAQGEGVALGADDTLYLAGEGGGRSRAGTFARLICN
jgi:hypothetical protein